MKGLRGCGRVCRVVSGGGWWWMRCMGVYGVVEEVYVCEGGVGRRAYGGGRGLGGVSLH